MPSRAASARERTRAALWNEILASARRQLAQTGAAALSVRAVARDVGMASSAIYRYVASRDELLTALIIAAYNDMGAAAEAAVDQAAEQPLVERFVAVWRAVRSWAMANPHEYGLIYGSPVPGYAAPADTIEPATRVPAVLLTLAAHMSAAQPANKAPPSTVEAEWLAPLAAIAPPDMSPRRLAAALTSWEALYGAISFELFGHLHNVVADDARGAFFDHQVRAMFSLVCDA